MKLSGNFFVLCKKKTCPCWFLERLQRFLALFISVNICHWYLTFDSPSDPVNVTGLWWAIQPVVRMIVSADVWLSQLISLWWHVPHQWRWRHCTSLPLMLPFIWTSKLAFANTLPASSSLFLHLFSKCIPLLLFGEKVAEAAVNVNNMRESWVMQEVHCTVEWMASCLGTGVDEASDMRKVYYRTFEQGHNCSLRVLKE